MITRAYDERHSSQWVTPYLENMTGSLVSFHIDNPQINAGYISPEISKWCTPHLEKYLYKYDSLDIGVSGWFHTGIGVHARMAQDLVEHAELWQMLPYWRDVRISYVRISFNLTRIGLWTLVKGEI